MEENKREEQKISRKDRIIYTIWFFAGLCVLVLSCLFTLKMAQSCKVPYLRLRQSHVEITRGEYFDAGAYVSAYSSERGTLQLPHVDTSQCGTQAVIYRLYDEMFEVDRILIVEIKNSSSETAVVE